MYTFSYQGSVAKFAIPLGVTGIRILAVGAAGGVPITGSYFFGGRGASIQGDFDVIPGQVKIY